MYYAKLFISQKHLNFQVEEHLLFTYSVTNGQHFDSTWAFVTQSVNVQKAYITKFINIVMLFVMCSRYANKNLQVYKNIMSYYIVHI